MNTAVIHSRFRVPETKRNFRQLVGKVSQVDPPLDLNREPGTEFIVHFQEVKFEQRT
jgi:hypothetical protein